MSSASSFLLCTDVIENTQVVNRGNHSHNNSNKEKPGKDTLGTCVWNINGLKHQKLDRIESENSKITQEIFSNNDIIWLTETWRDKNDRDLFD